MKTSSLKRAVEMLQNQGVKSTEFTLNMGRVFLLLADNPGLTQKEILGYLKMAPGNIARVIATLGDGTPNKCGLKLIEGCENEFDWRSDKYFLTNKGVELVARITNL